MPIVDAPQGFRLIARARYRNEYANDVLVIPITTHLRRMPTHVPLSPGAGGLPKLSMAKAEQITALPKTFLVRGPMGPRVSPGKLEELRRAVWRAMGGDEIAS